MELNRRDALIGVGVAVGAAVLVLFLKKPAASGGGTSNDIAGGFATANTVYVPTSSYTVDYNQYNGNVSYTTTNDTTTTTYSPVNSPGSPIIDVHMPPQAPASPVHVTGGGGVVNPPTGQTGKTGHAPAPSGAGTPAHQSPQAPKKMGNMHYATPKGGWNQNSVVDYIKEHGGYSDMASRTKLAGEMGIKGYTGTAAQNNTMLAKLKKIYGA